ncbi:MmcQ/YjbR family DNA-binding protein [Nocardia sp. 2TAF39]|uniref:MmcQ/YjbR family DNA-binding protein n=1 Tax=unclassified Nocardia TaxID=2637762 RepID=UPI003F9A4045
MSNTTLLYLRADSISGTRHKVAGKVSMLMTERSGEAIVTMKSLPEEATALRAPHSDITPGYHMNKKRWITVHPGGSVDEDQLRELVRESYRLVVVKLPRAGRPVDPDAL